MHRMPMVLSQPSFMWDRGMPEHILFERTLNPANIKETETFISILCEQTMRHNISMSKMVWDHLNRAEAMLNDTEINGTMEAIYLLNSIILRAPKDSQTLPIALKMRANLYFERCCFEGAASDYTMFLHVKKQSTPEEMCEVHGCLLVALYLMRQYSKSRKHLRIYKKFKAKIPRTRFVNSNLERIDLQVTYYVREMDEHENIPPPIVEKPPCAPYLGFNIDKNIPAASSVCFYKHDGVHVANSCGIYASCDIPKHSGVVLEEPLVMGVNMPFVQCECCFQRTDQIYTCLDCRYKTYCSLKCMEDDSSQHKLECIGYKYLILLILDARELFHMFLSTTFMLSEHIFSQKPKFRCIREVGEALEEIRKLIRNMGNDCPPFLKVLIMEPQYDKLSRVQYSTLIVTAFRLTLFIEKKTNIIVQHYNGLRLTSVEKRVVVGAILMRLHCYLLRNTLDFEYNYPTQLFRKGYDSMCDQIRQMRQGITPLGNYIPHIKQLYDADEGAIVDELFQTAVVPDNVNVSQAHDSQADNVNVSQAQQHKLVSKTLHRPVSIFKDKITEVFFNPDVGQSLLFNATAAYPLSETAITNINRRISELNEEDRQVLVKQFATFFHLYFDEYFLYISRRECQHRQIFVLTCPTVRKFRHSCDPNMDLIVLKNGFVYGKTLRDIKQGEELLGRYRVHYMRETRKERQLFLQTLNIECRCQYCQMPPLEEPANIRQGVYCGNCGMDQIVTPVDEKCPKCGILYVDLCDWHEKKMRTITNEKIIDLRSRDNEEALYLYHAALCNGARRLYVPGNETRLRFEMLYARYLALKNVAEQTCEMIRQIREDLDRYYTATSVIYSFYTDLLMIIKIILHNCLVECLCTSDIDCLVELCEIGLDLVNRQKEHLVLYEKFDSDSGRITADIEDLTTWKDLLRCSDAQRKKIQLADSEQSAEVVESNETDEMPNLAELSQSGTEIETSMETAETVDMIPLPQQSTATEESTEAVRMEEVTPLPPQSTEIEESMGTSETVDMIPLPQQSTEIEGSTETVRIEEVTPMPQQSAEVEENKETDELPDITPLTL